MNITVAYITNRREPMIGWFLDSLARELPGVQLVVVDFYAQYGRTFSLPDGAVHVAPKPTVWQGIHRRTRTDFFAAANARNTALCLTDTEWIVYCDDLSVLMPGWAKGIKDAMAGNYVVCGAYRKVNCLNVENGRVVSFENHPSGIDTRAFAVRGNDPVPATGGWLFGCSCAMPIDALLSVNGWDENCDGMGSEDYCTGIRMDNAGWQFRYDRRMMTYESEERHMDKITTTTTGDKGVSPNDKSHALLRAAQSSKWCSNYFEEGGIRQLRSRVLAGEPFPNRGIPEHDFYDGQLLREM